LTSHHDVLHVLHCQSSMAKSDHRNRVKAVSA